MEMLAIRIDGSLVLVTVIFQLKLFILLNLSYHNVHSSQLAQHRELPGSSISDPWRVDFGNWQVDYCAIIQPIRYYDLKDYWKMPRFPVCRSYFAGSFSLHMSNCFMSIGYNNAVTKS